MLHGKLLKVIRWRASNEVQQRNSTSMFGQRPSLDVLLDRRRPGFWSLFWKAPLVTLARLLYDARQSILVDAAKLHTNCDLPITIVCTSDTHNSQPTIPAGDLFIHAGDLSQGGTRDEIQEALNWINILPHQFKVVIAGNHDMYLDSKLNKKEDETISLNWGSIIYLQDTSTTLQFRGGRHLTVHGTPYTRKHGSWGFQFERNVDVFSNTVPEDTDILISHSPPRFHLDVAGWGDDSLLSELWRVKPKLHVFGHVHEGYGEDVLQYDHFQRYYESASRQSRYINVWYLVRMAVELLSMKLYNTGLTPHSTFAINPAAVGGLRDTLKRKPIVVTL